MKTNIVKITALLVIIASCMLACNDPKLEPNGNETPEDTTQIEDVYYTVNFAGEDISIASQTIEHGKLVTRPADPEIASYNFGGWFTDNGTFANEWNFKTDIVIQDTTLYAKWEENTSQNYPIEIPFTEYILKRTSGGTDDDDMLIVINSNEELESYINCSDVDVINYPKVDFSKQTLLLASGETHKGIYKFNSQLLQLSVNKYKVNVEILLGDSDCGESWIIAFVVNKLPQKSSIELNVTPVYNH